MAYNPLEYFEISIERIKYVFLRTFAPNSEFEASYKQCSVLYYVLNGEIECIKNDKSYIIKKNDFFCWDYGDSQKIINHTDEPCLAYIIGFLLSPKELSHIALNIPATGTIKNTYFFGLFSKIYNTWCEEKKGYMLKTYSQLYNIIYNLVSLTDADDSSLTTHYRLQKAIQYIYHEYSKEIKIEDLCNVCGYSKVHLNRLFMEHYNMPPKKFINRFRIHKAKTFLEDTDMTVAEIAADIGFNDISYFCRLFKKVTGSTPLEYKNIYISKYL